MTEINNALKTIITKYLEKECFTGVTCLVKKNGVEISRLEEGFLQKGDHRKIDSNSIYDLASVSKIVTSTIILKFISDGMISLETTLGHCLPEVEKHPILKDISIKQLLTHNSGLIAWYPFYSELPNDNLFDILSKIELQHQEDKTVYSDLNFILLGEVVKKLTNMSLQQSLKKYIIEPLKMETMTFGPIKDERFEHVVATEFGNRIEMKMCEDRQKDFDGFRDTSRAIVGEVNDGNCHYFFNGQSGHAGIFATADDLSKLANLYLKGGSIDGKEYIVESLIKQSMNKQTEDRGLGWQINEPFPIGCGHTGFTGTSIWLVPEIELEVILLTNRLNVENPTNINPFRKEIFNQILKEIHQK